MEGLRLKGDRLTLTSRDPSEMPASPAAGPLPSSRGDAAPSRTGPDRSRPAALLLVLSDPLARAALAYLLGQTGLRVQTAGSAGEAADLARAGRFDLLILDERLAPQDGLAALEAIRRDPAGRSARALLLARSSVTTIALRCAALNAEPMPISDAAHVEALLNRVASMFRAEGRRGQGPLAVAA